MNDAQLEEKRQVLTEKFGAGFLPWFRDQRSSPHFFLLRQALSSQPDVEWALVISLGHAFKAGQIHERALGIMGYGS